MFKVNNKIKQTEKRNISVQNSEWLPFTKNSSPDVWFHIPALSKPQAISTGFVSLAHIDLSHWFHGTLFLLDISGGWSRKDVVLLFEENSFEERSVSVVTANASIVNQWLPKVSKAGGIF